MRFNLHNRNKIGRASIILGSVFTCLMGVIFLVITFFVSFHDDGRTYEKTQATIVSTENEQFLCDYTVNGITYEDVYINYYDSAHHVGDVIEIRYDVDDPSFATIGRANLAAFVMGGVGVLLIGLSIYRGKRSIKQLETQTKLEKQNAALETSDLNNVDASQSKVLGNSDLDGEFFFHVNTGFDYQCTMEDRNKVVVYENVIVEKGFLKPKVMEFRNKDSLYSRKYKIGAVITTSSGTRSFQHVEESKFNIDGMDCWEFLLRKNINVEMDIKGLRGGYNIYRGKTLIGILESTNTKGFANTKEQLVGFNGFYMVRCSYDNLDDVYMTAFIVSRCR